MEPPALPQSAIPQRLYYILPLSTHLSALLSTIPTALPLTPVAPPPTHSPPPGTIPSTRHPLHPSFAYLDYPTPYIRVWDTVSAAKLAAEKAGKEIGGEWKVYPIRRWELGYIVGSPGREGEFLVRQPPDIINLDRPEGGDKGEGEEMEGVQGENQPVKTERARLGEVKSDRRGSRKPAVEKGSTSRNEGGEGVGGDKELGIKVPAKKTPVQERGGVKSDKKVRGGEDWKEGMVRKGG